MNTNNKIEMLKKIFTKPEILKELSNILQVSNDVLEKSIKQNINNNILYGCITNNYTCVIISWSIENINDKIILNARYGYDHGSGIRKIEQKQINLSTLMSELEKNNLLVSSESEQNDSSILSTESRQSIDYKKLFANVNKCRTDKDAFNNLIKDFITNQ